MNLTQQISEPIPRTGKGLKRQHNNEDEVINQICITNHFKITKSSQQFRGNKPVSSVPIKVEPDYKVPSFDIVESIPCHLVGMARAFLELEIEMTRELQQCLQFYEPVSCIYNPLDYALDPHSNFLQHYCDGTKRFLFLGMNPGPFGMVQTGVPFGEVTMVRDWLQGTGDVRKPSVEHPKRPILGFHCKRKEVSGSRFWGYFQRQCVNPERFFKHCFIHNMCPLAFMNANGKNLTPPDLKVEQRKPLNDLCARYLCRVVELLQVKVIIGIGNFARDRARDALSKGKVNGVKVEVILHPSPASPAANKGWDAVVDKQLKDIGVDAYL